MSKEERKMKGIHIQYGEMTVAEIIEHLIVKHSEEHLNQIRSTLRS